MQTPTKEWIHKAVDGLPDQETEQLKDYLEFLTWKVGEKKSSPEQTKKNPTAQRIIKAMEKPPYVSSEDIESLLQVIKEAKQPTHFESPFEPDGQED